MDHKISNILSDTETLLHSYKKKVGEIATNLESMRRFKLDINQ